MRSVMVRPPGGSMEVGMVTTRGIVIPVHTWAPGGSGGVSHHGRAGGILVGWHHPPVASVQGPGLSLGREIALGVGIRVTTVMMVLGGVSPSVIRA